MKKPLYLLTYENLRKEISDGVYTYGSRLPSRRVYAEQNGISTVTVSHAYDMLCDEGYVRSKEKSGYYVIFREPELFPVSNSHVTVQTNNSHHVNSFPFTVLSRTMRRVITEYGEEILKKTPNKGSLLLREAISAYLRRSRGICADAENIIIGSGAEYLYGIVLRLLGRNRKYAIETPSYVKISQVYAAEGIEFEKLPLGRSGIESKALQNTDAEVLHITPYRSFPTDITATASKRSEYLRWAEEKTGLLLKTIFIPNFLL